MKKYKIFKKQGILKNILCVSLSLLVGFVSTYGLFFFSVDSYKYSSEKDTKTFSDVGYENFDVTETDSITRYGKQSTPTSYEVNKLYSCLSNAEYKELPLFKAFPLFWIVFTPKNYICDLNTDNPIMDGTVFISHNSVYIVNYNSESDSNIMSLTVYKAIKVDYKTIKKIGGAKDSDLKYVGTIYQYLYKEAVQKDWYFHFIAIFIAISIAAYFFIIIIRRIKCKL